MTYDHLFSHRRPSRKRCRRPSRDWRIHSRTKARANRRDWRKREIRRRLGPLTFYDMKLGAKFLYPLLTPLPVLVIDSLSEFSEVVFDRILNTQEEEELGDT